MSNEHQQTARMPLPSRKRSLEAGATFIEQDLHRFRQRAQEEYESRKARMGEAFDGLTRPITSSHEGDLMQVAHLATAAATLRAMAEVEES